MSGPVTVVIPTLNAGRRLPRLLRAVRTQTVPCGVLVIDSSSSDDTVLVAQSFGAKTVVIRREDFDHGGTRSIAAQEAAGDILVFLTQDVLPADECAIEQLIEPLSRPRIGASYGRQMPDAGASPFAAHTRLFKYPAEGCVKSSRNRERYGIATPFLSDSFSAYRKEALREIGWFKHGIIFAEDVYAGAKLVLAGYEIVYVPGAAVVHSHNHTMTQEFRRYFDTAVFYESEAWIEDAFGKNSAEAWRYLKSEFFFVIQKGGARSVLEFFPRNALRIMGYFLGRCHKLLPQAFCRMLSAHPGWWKGTRLSKRAV